MKMKRKADIKTAECEKKELWLTDTNMQKTRGWLKHKTNPTEKRCQWLKQVQMKNAPTTKKENAANETNLKYEMLQNGSPPDH